MNRIADKLNNASQSDSGSAAMTVIDRLQSFQPGPQVVGLAAAFLFVCEHYGVAPQEAFTVTKNMMNDADRKLVPEFRAVKMYVEKELP